MTENCVWGAAEFVGSHRLLFLVYRITPDMPIKTKIRMMTKITTPMTLQTWAEE